MLLSARAKGSEAAVCGATVGGLGDPQGHYSPYQALISPACDTGLGDIYWSKLTHCSSTLMGINMDRVVLEACIGGGALQGERRNDLTKSLHTCRIS